MGQFTNDVGQAVMGADQTVYLLRPYEMILCTTYASLDSLMLGSGACAPFAREAAIFMPGGSLAHLADDDGASVPIGTLRRAFVARLGGTTGDTAGALLELGECAVLLALALLV